MALELKRCPFCGEPARAMLSNDRVRPYARIACTGCEVTTRVVMGDLDGRLAAEVWNSRVSV